MKKRWELEMKGVIFFKCYSKWWIIDLCWVMGMLTLVMFIHETNNGNHWLKQRSMSLKWSMAMITNLPLASPTNPPCSAKLPLHTNTPPLSTSDLFAMLQQHLMVGLQCLKASRFVSFVPCQTKSQELFPSNFESFGRMVL